MAEREYRVRWRREGQTRDRIMLYQTLGGAKRCVHRQETARAEMTWVADHPHGQLIPEIVFGPVIESREVGEWGLKGTDDFEHLHREQTQTGGAA